MLLGVLLGVIFYPMYFKPTPMLLQHFLDRLLGQRESNLGLFLMNQSFSINLCYFCVISSNLCIYERQILDVIKSKLIY